MQVECQSPTDISTVSIQFATQNSYLLHDGYYSSSIIGLGSVHVGLAEMWMIL